MTSLLIASLVATGAFAAPAEIDRAASAMNGKEAQFTQRFTPKGFKNAQSESGSVVFGTMPMMRWSYTSPEEKLFVFDGSQSWLYVPADKQVTIGRIDESRKRELPFLVLGDPQTREKYFSVVEKAVGGTVVTTLQPKDAAAMIRNIVITTGAADHLIRSVEYTDREGNRTVFELSGYHPRAAAVDLFRFTPPAGVQVINAE
jgi:outer membrane lipoprotein carrier protein